MKKYNLFSSKSIIYIILVICSIVVIFPYFWMILTSFKSRSESIHLPPTFFPKHWITDNYKHLFEILPFFSFYINTITYTLVSVILQLFIASLAGYVFAKMSFPGNKILFTIVLSMLMIPAQTFIIPQFLIIQKLHLLNTILALILPTISNSYGIFLIRQHVLTIPESLFDAAAIDGCNPFQVYYHVVLPLIISGLISFGIITTIWTWNSLLWPMIVNSSPDKLTLSAGLALLKSRGDNQYPLMMAGAFLSSLPILIIFIITQKRVVEGIANTGIK